MHDNTIELGNTIDNAITEMEQQRRRRENRQIAFAAVLFTLLGSVAAIVVLGLLPGWLGY